MKKIDKVDKLKKRLLQTQNSNDPNKDKKILIIQSQINYILNEAI